MARAIAPRFHHRLHTLAAVATLLAAGMSPFCPAAAQLPTGTWQMLWADEFNLAGLDSLKWNYGYPWGANTHNHHAYARPENVAITDGRLVITALEESFGGKNYTTGVINTRNKLNLTQGYIEARMQMPDTIGSWPALWMTNINNGWPPEIDIMEFTVSDDNGDGIPNNGNLNRFYTNYHWSNAPNPGTSSDGGWVEGTPNLSSGFHIFGVRWEPTSLQFYLDGVLRRTINRSQLDQATDMQLILNYAVGFTGDGWVTDPTSWPVGGDTFEVDWVRVWKLQSATTTNWSYTGSSESVQWDSAGNWSNGSPNLGGVTANFGTVTPAEQRLDWSGIRTVSHMNFSGGTRYVVGFPDDRLLLVGSNNAAGNASITVNNSATNVVHTIRAETELWSTVAITNNSDQPLMLSGRLIGGGGVTVNGPGPILFSNSNTYAGNTLIESGSQGPGIARVTSSSPFGSGTVTIGEQGNSTTGRIEVENFVDVPNAINFSGRNNSSAGILNRSGNNEFSGTIAAQVGGGQYIIQSDSGGLILSGSADGANGVALQNAAGGTRTFTLQGNGSGLVSGRIENGGGVTAITKTGAGAWGLGADNTYTGTTTVANGTLYVFGTTGTGSTTVQNGATLRGDGMVAGGLSVFGEVRPGISSTGTMSVTGNATFYGGASLMMELAASGHDHLDVTGQLGLGGDLNVVLVGGFSPAAGSSFDLFDWGTRVGTFANVNLPTLSGRKWDATALYTDGVLAVVAALAGDYNFDGTVNAADYTVWRNMLGQMGMGLAADGTGPSGVPDGVVNQLAYEFWKLHYGETIQPDGVESVIDESVPEPAGAVLFALAAACLAAGRRFDRGTFAIWDVEK